MKFLLVDMMNILNRAKHVANSGYGSLSDRAGMAVHLSLMIIRKAWNDFGIEHIVIAMDHRSWRKDFSESYKANRQVAKDAMPAALMEEEKIFWMVLDEFSQYIKTHTNCTVLHKIECEADDFIARWIRLHPHDEHIIASGDSDLWQLLAANVIQYDGVKRWTYKLDGTFDENGKQAVKKVIKDVVDPLSGKKRKETVTIPIDPVDPQWELFKKIIRGDGTDNIMSAYPGVREIGTKKKAGIREAFNDRLARGFDWNAVMQQEWDKLIGSDDEGKPVVLKVRVLDEFRKNEKLIDLTKQPPEIITLMDEAIVESLEQPMHSAQEVGFQFMKFVKATDLRRIAEDPKIFTQMFAAVHHKNRN